MIEIYLLGRFEIIVNGKKASRSLEGSRKGKLLLEYLLLANELVSSSELCEVLWPEHSNKNPEAALKTLISRTRNELRKFDQTLGECIVTVYGGGYRWNDDLDCMVDVHTFEKRCRELLTSHDEDIAMDCEGVLSMYAGDLKYGKQGEKQFLSRSIFYRNLYLCLAAHTVSLLKKQNDWRGVIRICRRVLEINAFDETMHLELMKALVQSNRATEAVVHYRNANSLHHKCFGTPLPDCIEDFYRLIINGNSKAGAWV